jgi:hypothetical protein
VSPLALVVRWLSLLACAFVVLSFLYFLVDQTSEASRNQVNAIGGQAGVKIESATKVPDPPAAVEKVREQENDGFHEFVDDVNDVLLSPFTGIVDSDNVWVLRLVPLALALLIYGLLGQYLARAMGLRRW